MQVIAFGWCSSGNFGCRDDGVRGLDKSSPYKRGDFQLGPFWMVTKLTWAGT